MSSKEEQIEKTVEVEIPQIKLEFLKEPVIQVTIQINDLPDYANQEHMDRLVHAMGHNPMIQHDLTRTAKSFVEAYDDDDFLLIPPYEIVDFLQQACQTAMIRYLSPWAFKHPRERLELIEVVHNQKYFNDLVQEHRRELLEKKKEERPPEEIV